MGRRENLTGDSFDLFLDTICNTFGGIVFLAILVALLAKFRQDPSGTQTAEKPVSLAQMQELELSLEQQQARLSELQLLRDKAQPVVAISQLAQLIDRQNELDDLRDTENQLIKQRQELGKELVNIASEAANIPLQVVQAEEQQARIAAELTTALANWKIVRKQKAKTLQVPEERRGAGARGIVLLSGGELFLVCSPDHRTGEFFDPHVRAIPILGTNGYEISPRIGKGLEIGGEKSTAAIRGTAQRLSRGGSNLIVVVYPDSYHQFGPVRDTFKSFGINYDLWIHSENEKLQVSYGPGRNRVQ